MNITKRDDYTIHLKSYRGYAVQNKNCNFCLEEASTFERLLTLTLKDIYAAFVIIISVINGKIHILVWLEKTLSAISVFLRDWYRGGFKLFWEEEFRACFNCKKIKRVWFYVIVVRTTIDRIINLLIFIWLLQKCILHMRILCVILL